MARKTAFLGEKLLRKTLIFHLKKGKKKSDPIEGIGLSFLLVPTRRIELPTY
jgi:hypothetical protein